MAYTYELSRGQQLYLDNSGTQTAIAIASSTANQQQSQRTSLETGKWIVPPTLWSTPDGIVLQIEAQKGQYFIQIQAGGLNILAKPPSLSHAEVLPLVRSSDQTTSGESLMPPMEPMQPMEPIKPMEPMQMGNMEMRLKPMEMRLGNMEMRIGQPSGKRFCAQCGQPVNESDRFCFHCGHQLSNHH